MPLTPAVFHILLALAIGEMHGYAIMQQVKEDTRAQIRMSPGTLYGTIKRMLSANLIEESEDGPDPDMDDQRRRYYRLTGFGQRVLSAEVDRLANLLRVAGSKQLFKELSLKYQLRTT